MISKNGLNAFLKDCMRHYPNSLVMRYANLEAQYKLMKFMVDEFLPVWKTEILRHMTIHKCQALDETVILEGIHSKLYLEGGFATKESQIFQTTDPEGYQNYMKHTAKEVFTSGDNLPHKA